MVLNLLKVCLEIFLVLLNLGFFAHFHKSLCKWLPPFLRPGLSVYEVLFIYLTCDSVTAGSWNFTEIKIYLWVLIIVARNFIFLLLFLIRIIWINFSHRYIQAAVHIGKVALQYAFQVHRIVVLAAALWSELLLTVDFADITFWGNVVVITILLGFHIYVS